MSAFLRICLSVLKGVFSMLSIEWNLPTEGVSMSAVQTSCCCTQFIDHIYCTDTYWFGSGCSHSFHCPPNRQWHPCVDECDSSASHAKLRLRSWSGKTRRLGTVHRVPGRRQNRQVISCALGLYSFLLLLFLLVGIVLKSRNCNVCFSGALKRGKGDTFVCDGSEPPS